MGNVSETPTPTTCRKSMAVHLQFVRQYPPHLHGRTFLASKLRRKGNPAIRLPFVRQYAPHLYGNTFGETLGVGVTRTFLTEVGVSKLSFPATGTPDPGRVSEGFEKGSLKGSLKGFLKGFRFWVLKRVLG